MSFSLGQIFHVHIFLPVWQGGSTSNWGTHFSSDNLIKIFSKWGEEVYWENPFLQDIILSLIFKLT